jgi:hypothetical protein
MRSVPRTRKGSYSPGNTSAVAAERLRSWVRSVAYKISTIRSVEPRLSVVVNPGMASDADRRTNCEVM